MARHGGRQRCETLRPGWSQAARRRLRPRDPWQGHLFVKTRRPAVPRRVVRRLVPRRKHMFGSDSANFWHAKSSMDAFIVWLGTKQHASLRGGPARVLSHRSSRRSCRRSTVSPTRSAHESSGAFTFTMKTGSTSGLLDREHTRAG